MAFFDDIRDKAVDFAQTGIAKSKQLAELAKLKGANLSEEEAIKKAYIEIGKLYYAERGMAPEPAYAALCEKITAAKVNIEENKARMETIRQDGVVEVDSATVVDATTPEAPAASQEAPAAPEDAPSAPGDVPSASEEPAGESETPPAGE